MGLCCANLTLFSRRNVSEVDEEIVRLWSHMFAGVLAVGLDVGGISYTAAYILAKNQQTMLPFWPQWMSSLSAIIHMTANHTDVQELYASKFFFRLNEQSKDDKDEFSLPIDPTSGLADKHLVLGL